MNGFLDRKAKTGNTMIKNADAHAERWLPKENMIGDAPAPVRLLGKRVL